MRARRPDPLTPVILGLPLAGALENIDRATTPQGLFSTLFVHGHADAPITDLLASHAAVRAGRATATPGRA